MTRRFAILLLLLTAVAGGGYWAWCAYSSAREESLTQAAAGEVPTGRASANWPGLFGPFNDSTSSETGLNLDWSKTGPPVVWRKPVGSGYASPVVWGNRLIVFFREGNKEILECRDLKTGDSQWRIARPTAYKCKYDYSSGPYSTPVTDGERVYAVGAEGRFFCVTLESGEPVWERVLTKEFDVPPGNFAVAASPLLENDRLIFNLGGVKTSAGIVALDKLTGKTLWKATKDAAGYATPRAATIHGRRLVFVLTGDGLVCLDPADGRVLWSKPYKANHPEYVNATSPLVRGDLVFVSVQKKGSFCIRILPDGQYETVWRKRRGFQSQYSTLIGIDGHAYGFDSSARTFCCVRLADGDVRWQWPGKEQEGVGRGQAIAVADRFLLFGEYGNLASLAINSHKPILKSLSGELLKRPCYSSPALAGGRLILRNEREVICLDLR